MQEIFFDNASTTIPDDCFFEEFKKVGTEFYGNPSSLHTKGIETQRKINEIRKLITEKLNAQNGRIIFTSGGTESNNLAIFGLNNKKIVTIKNQHPSITEPIKSLKDNSEVIYLSVSDGFFSYEELENAIDEKTTLVILSHVNNETGIIYDLEKIGNIIKSKNSKTLFHVDGVQGFGKIPINISKSKIDSYTFSLHKVHGIKGVGGLFIRNGVNISPIIFGGLQQDKIRPGTENTVSVIASKKIIEKAFCDTNEKFKKVTALKKLFIDELGDIGDYVINGEIEKTSPYILNISFANVLGEILLNALSAKKIFVSTGSACSGKSASENLINHNFKEDRSKNSIRFSFSKDNSEDEVIRCVNVLKDEIKIIGRVMKRK